MARLLKKDVQLMQRLGVEPFQAFNASGLSRSEYRERMKDEGKLCAFGVTPCIRGHALRNRHGNCLHCRPEALTYSRRYYAQSYVYIATSKAQGITKIGMSDDPANRIYIANLEGFARANDWQIRLQILTEAAGQVEHSLIKALAARRWPVRWLRNGVECESTETFKCSFVLAKRTLLAQVQDRISLISN